MEVTQRSILCNHGNWWRCSEQSTFLHLSSPFNKNAGHKWGIWNVWLHTYNNFLHNHAIWSNKVKISQRENCVKKLNCIKHEHFIVVCMVCTNAKEWGRDLGWPQTFSANSSCEEVKYITFFESMICCGHTARMS